MAPNDTDTAAAAGGADGPASKKARVGGDAVLGVVRASLMAPDSVEAIAAEYRTSQPYLHCSLKDVFVPEELALVRDEIVENIQATYKETDLFKLFQTGAAPCFGGPAWPPAWGAGVAEVTPGRGAWAARHCLALLPGPLTTRSARLGPRERRRPSSHPCPS
jgi:hypothetical protein